MMTIDDDNIQAMGASTDGGKVARETGGGGGGLEARVVGRQDHFKITVGQNIVIDTCRAQPETGARLELIAWSQRTLACAEII